MENGILAQLYSMLVFIISGMLIGIFFDIFRILRKTFRTSDVITYIEDIIFWIITSFFLIFVIFNFTNGEIRFYNIISLIFGSLLYIILISKFFIKINVKLVLFIKKATIMILKIFLTPIRFLTKILQKIFKPFTFLVLNTKNILLNFKKSKKIRKKHRKRRIKKINVEKYN